MEVNYFLQEILWLKSGVFLNWEFLNECFKNELLTFDTTI